jgi:hypothetical protein
MDMTHEGPVMLHQQIGSLPDEHRFSWEQVHQRRKKLQHRSKSRAGLNEELIDGVLVAAAAAAVAAEEDESWGGRDEPFPPQPSAQAQAPELLPDGREERVWHSRGRTGTAPWWPPVLSHEKAGRSPLSSADGGAAQATAGTASGSGSQGGGEGRLDQHQFRHPRYDNGKTLDTFSRPARAMEHRLRQLRELAPGLRPENQTAVQTIRLRTPGNYGDRPGDDRPAGRYLFRSPLRAATYHGLAALPPLPAEATPAGGALARLRASEEPGTGDEAMVLTGQPTPLSPPPLERVNRSLSAEELHRKRLLPWRGGGLAREGSGEAAGAEEAVKLPIEFGALLGASAGAPMGATPAPGQPRGRAHAEGGRSPVARAQVSPRRFRHLRGVFRLRFTPMSHLFR